MRRIHSLGALLVATASITLMMLLAAGCSQDKPQGPLSGLPQGEADRLSSQHGRFESAEDPPFTADTHYAAGQLAESRDDPARAIEQYQKALKQDPKHLNAMYRLAVVYVQTKQYPRAIETWQNYIKATNGSATGYSNLGFAYELAGRPNDAEAAYRKGIEKDAKDRPCRVNYGLMLARAGRVDEATAQLQAVLAPAEVHYNLGSVYELRGHKEQAKAEYRKALELDANLVDAQTRLSALE